jgi:hypothetical protein
MFSGTRIGSNMKNRGLPDPRNPETGVEECFNIICLSPDAYDL